MIKKIVSGAQTGVDIAALDVAKKYDIPYAGWCPQGRINEKGVISKDYSFLQEVEGIFKDQKENYAARTKRNIVDSDGTLILVPKIPLPLKIQDGTLLTIQEVQKQNKPYLLIDLSKTHEKNSILIAGWIGTHKIEVLNVAGPRESTWPGIYQSSFNLLENVIPLIYQNS